MKSFSDFDVTYFNHIIQVLLVPFAFTPDKCVYETMSIYDFILRLFIERLQKKE